MAKIEEAREVWEYEIDDLKRRKAQTHEEDDQTVRDEKTAIIACLIFAYEERFGIKYPDTLNEL